MDNFEIGKQCFLEGLKQLESSNVEEAIAQFKKSLHAVPGRISTLVNLSAAHIQAKQFVEAEKVLQELANIDRNVADLWLNRGLIAKSRGDLQGAVDHFNQALEIDPGLADAYLNKAFALQEQCKYEASLAALKQSIAIDGASAAAYNCKGQLLASLKSNEESVIAYQTGLAIDPNFKFLQGSLLHAKMHICDWANFDRDVNTLSQNIKAKNPVSSPFPMLSLLDDPELHRIASELYTALEHPNPLHTSQTGKYSPKSKIRIGYFSADFHRHATAYLMAELFELHDKERFETVAFSFGPQTNDEMQQRLTKAFDQFIHVNHKTDREIANLARELEIDIAIDLKGFTTDYRAGIFANRAAPIQVNYLGYPGTMRAQYIDYLIGDCVVTPPESASYYTEKLALLPHCYQPNDQSRMIANEKFSKENMGLSNDQFVFCCFNNNYKITPDIFKSWMHLLQKIEGSVLWLLEDNAAASKNLTVEAKKFGIHSDRLIFAKRLDLPRHLARHQCADLFLDTFPYNAHTTASDSLWAGLPVLTMAGKSFASRVAASLLTAIGLSELITHTPEEYEALAIDLASNPRKLQAIKEKLAANRLTTPLFDTKGFTQDIEGLYLKMYERHQSGLGPAMIQTNL